MSINSRRLIRGAPKVSPPSTGPLQLLNISRSLSSGSATITWQTNKPASSNTSIYFAPAKGCSWNWQLNGTIDTSANAQVYDFDAFDNTASLVSQLRTRNIYCIAYFSAGSWEDWRPDAANFPASVKGNNLDGWAGEKWLDVRQLAILRPLMGARADIAKSKGFNAIEWDNVDGYTNNPGFSMTRADQLAYNKMLAEVTHERGMACFLKNAVDDAASLQPYFDGIVIEQSYEYNETDKYISFPNANKPALVCEYQTPSAADISHANANGFSLIKHTLDLDQKYLVSYVTSPPAAVTLTNTQSPKTSASQVMNHAMTFTGLTPGQRYSYLVWSQVGSEIIYDPIPRNFVAI